MSLSKTRLAGFVMVLVLVGVTAGALWWANVMPRSTGDGSSAPARSLKPPDRPGVFRMTTTLKLSGREKTRIIRKKFRVRFESPERLQVTRTRRRVGGFGSGLRRDTTTMSLVLNGDRYLVRREGVVLLAGRSDSAASDVVRGLPGGTSYLVSQLLDRDPFLESPPNRSRSDGGIVLRTDTQSVSLGPRGIVRHAEGPTKWLYYSLNPYYRVDYAETVARLPSKSKTATEPPPVPDRVLRMARAETGTRLPNHRFRTLDGQMVRLHEIEGPKLINQWASWCPPCIAEIPHLNDIHERFGDRITVLGTTAEDTPAVRKFLSDQPVQYRILFHGAPKPVPYRNFRTLPFTFLVDGNNRLRAVIRGAHTEQQWAALIRRYLLKNSP